MNNEVEAGQIAISIEGDEFDLNQACQVFSRGTLGLSIRRLHIPPNDGIFLLSEELDRVENDRERFRAAGRLIEQINGIFFIDDAARKPLRLRGTMHRKAVNGNWGVMIMLPSLTLQLRGGAVAEPLQSGQPTYQESLLNLSLNEEDVMDVLVYLRDMPDWVDLYKAVEVMRANMSRRYGSIIPIEINWPSKKAIERFKIDSQFFRHSKEKWAKSDTSSMMQLSEAQTFVRNMCRAWLRTFY